MEEEEEGVGRKEAREGSCRTGRRAKSCRKNGQRGWESKERRTYGGGFRGGLAPEVRRGSVVEYYCSSSASISHQL